MTRPKVDVTLRGFVIRQHMQCLGTIETAEHSVRVVGIVQGDIRLVDTGLLGRSLLHQIVSRREAMREAMRHAMPQCAAFIDDLERHLGPVQMLRARENGIELPGEDAPTELWARDRVE